MRVMNACPGGALCRLQARTVALRVTSVVSIEPCNHEDTERRRDGAKATERRSDDVMVGAAGVRSVGGRRSDVLDALPAQAICRRLVTLGSNRVSV